MLNHITVHNFAIVEHLELDLCTGMTVITGETGAGKSIMLDAMGLTLGGRADSGAVRAGTDRAEVHASFDINTLPEAANWLAEKEIEHDNEVILRRTITKEGRSRAFINGLPCTLQDLKSIGELLIDIHGQHAHQSLLKKETHKRLLDEHASAENLAKDVTAIYQLWKKSKTAHENLSTQNQEQSAQLQLLRYQCEELDTLEPTEHELSDLEQEQEQLANAEESIQQGQHLLEICRDGNSANISALFSQALTSLDDTNSNNPQVTEARDLLESAKIQLEEAADTLQDHFGAIEINPARLQEVEQRLSSIYDIARKHKIKPSNLIELHQNLQQQLDQLQNADVALEEFELEIANLEKEYTSAAKKLSKARKKAASTFSKSVTEQIQQLGMPGGNFTVALIPHEKNELNRHGLENVEFQVSTNPGQPTKGIAKIASGGELSRISLAIQVIAAQASKIPTLVFDEVDVGIGGAVAEVVGRLLRALGSQGQVLCVTHLPQVAAQGHQHLNVIKTTDGTQTQTGIDELPQEEKVKEIARMLGGINLTEQSLAHAKEMLESSAS